MIHASERGVGMKDVREALKGLLRSLGLEERSRGFQAAESWPDLKLLMSEVRVGNAWN